MRKQLNILFVLMVCVVYGNGRSVCAADSVANTWKNLVIEDSTRVKYGMTIPSKEYFNTDTIVLTVRNYTDKYVDTGGNYDIEYFDGERWTSPFNDYFIDVAYPVPAHGVFRIHITLGDRFKPGKYRIVKKVDGVLLTCDFKILPAKRKWWLW